MLAITLGIATAILKDFFHLWSSDLIDHLIAFDMERVSCLYVSYFFFSIAKPLATDTQSMSIWEKLEFELIFSLIYVYSLLLVYLQIPNSQK